jgi:hypothetical protein
MFDEWDVAPYLANAARVGNIIKNIGLATGLKCVGNAFRLQKEKWEVKRQVAYYQPGNPLEGISVEDRMIAFISSV